MREGGNRSPVAEFVSASRGLRAPTGHRGALIFAVIFALVLLSGGSRLVLFPPNAPAVRIASLSKSDGNCFDLVLLGSLESQMPVRDGAI
jgi:hypothetical protein